MARASRAMGVVRNPLVLSLLSALEWLSYHPPMLVWFSSRNLRGITDRGIESAASAVFPMPAIAFISSSARRFTNNPI